MRRTAIATALLLTTLTACGGSSDTKPAPAPAVENNPAGARPTPTDAGPFVLGKAYAWSKENDLGSATGTTSVLSYTQPARGVTPPGDGLGVSNAEWGVVEVKVCNVKGDSIAVSQSPWSLAFPNETRTETTGLNGGDLPKPEFPTLDTMVKSGDCLRGKIPYPVERGKRPDRIVYAPVSEPEPIEWIVPAK